jgi:hypothetical protein
MSKSELVESAPVDQRRRALEVAVASEGLRGYFPSAAIKSHQDEASADPDHKPRAEVAEQG